MAATWVALLRGINVGGRNTVPMAALRRVCEEAGCGDVRTVIQSGNVVFTSDDRDRAQLRQRLEEAVATAFDVPSTVVLLKAAELGALVRAHPFGDDGAHTFVTFLAEKPKPDAVRALADRDVAPDRVEVRGSDVFLHLPNGVTGARLSGTLVERLLGVPGTARNWRTVTKLVELACSPD